jgi:uncharacterized protein
MAAPRRRAAESEPRIEDGGVQMTQVPIAENLFSGPDAAPRLVGSRCAACGAYAFPLQGWCPRCGGEMERVELSPTGTVWTWTSQEFLPPAPPYAGPETTETFERYYVGYVELEDQLRVESRLIGFGENAPYIGQKVETVVLPFRTDDEGHEVMTYAFAPAKESSND